MRHSFKSQSQRFQSHKVCERDWRVVRVETPKELTARYEAKPPHTSDSVHFAFLHEWTGRQRKETMSDMVCWSRSPARHEISAPAGDAWDSMCIRLESLNLLCIRHAWKHSTLSSTLSCRQSKPLNSSCTDMDRGTSFGLDCTCMKNQDQVNQGGSRQYKQETFCASRSSRSIMNSVEFRRDICGQEASCYGARVANFRSADAAAAGPTCDDVTLSRRDKRLGETMMTTNGSVS